MKNIFVIKGNKKHIIGRLLSVLFLMVLVCENWCGWDIRYSFAAFVVITYISLMPLTILNPKNMVFFFYFAWYVLGPFGSNYKRYFVTYKDYSNEAFLMLFSTYIAIMITLDILIGKESVDYDRKAYSLIGIEVPITVRLVLLILLILTLSIFISRTGGLKNWFGDNLSAGHFSRRGSGLYSLIYQYIYYFLIFVEGQQKIDSPFKLLRRFFYLATLPLMFVFIGSKGQMLLCILLLFAPILLNEKLITWKTVVLVVTGIAIYLINMYIRVGNWHDSLGHTLNYLDTLEKFMMVLRDYKPGFMTTFYMPFTWPFVKLGLLPDTVYYDFNIWLTDMYNHNKWAILQATDQWNIETDMYLNFGFVFGIPFVILLFSVIAKIYVKAKNVGGCWIYIYMLEYMYILSHLRGGIILFWDWFLIPLFVWIIWRYAKDTKMRISLKDQ